MARNRKSAKQAGATFARMIADYFKSNGFEFADKKPLYGAKDRGDIGGVRTMSGKTVTIECKNYSNGYDVAGWLREAEEERLNDDGAVGVVVAKKRGVTAPGKQVVFMTMDDLLVLLTGERPGE